MNTSARSPVVNTSSTISVNRVSLPLRATTADPSPKKCAGWLQTCFSFDSVARIAPRRAMPSANSIFECASLSTCWYISTCSRVSVQYTLFSNFSGRSAIIRVSVFNRRSRNGDVSRFKWLATSLSRLV